MDVPSLRERKDDIASIINSYIEIYANKYAKIIKNISVDALNMLTQYSWPGNYRELECIIENAVVSCDSDTLTIKEIFITNKMLAEQLGATVAANLFEFRNNVDGMMVDVFYKKTGSEDISENLLDISKTKLRENIVK